MDDLKAHIQDTPELAALLAAGNDVALAEALNATSEDVWVPRDVFGRDILAAVDPKDAIATADAFALFYFSVIAASPYPLRLMDRDGHTLTVLGEAVLHLFKAHSDTRARLTTLAASPGSLAESMLGRKVSFMDIGELFRAERRSVYWAAPERVAEAERDARERDANERAANGGR